MKTLVCKKPGEFAYEEREAPVLQKKQAIIMVKRIGICGTDLHAFEGTQPFFTYPRVLGHELAGELGCLDDEVSQSAGDGDRSSRQHIGRRHSAEQVRHEVKAALRHDRVRSRVAEAGDRCLPAAASL